MLSKQVWPSGHYVCKHSHTQNVANSLAHTYTLKILFKTSAQVVFVFVSIQKVTVMQPTCPTAEQKLLHHITDGSLEPFVISGDNIIFFNIYRFITRACGKQDDTDYGCSRWKHMTTPIFKKYNEMTRLLQMCRKIKPYRCPHHTMSIPCTNVKGLQILLDILGDKVTNGYRKAFENALQCSTISNTQVIPVAVMQPVPNATIQVPISEAKAALQEERTILQAKCAALTLEEAALDAKQALVVAEAAAAAKNAEVLQLMQQQQQKKRPRVSEATTNSGVYVLEASNGTFYVGSSHNITKRIEQHKAGFGSKCTRMRGLTYKSVLPLTRGSTAEMLDWERKETLERMYKHGINKVRGWIFAKSPAKLSPEDTRTAWREICSGKDLCYKCGSKGHFSTECRSDSKPSWYDS